GLLLGIYYSDPFAALFDKAEAAVRNMPIADFVAGTAGLAIGLFIAFMLSQLTQMVRFAWLSITLSVLLYVVLGYFFAHYFATRRRELVQHFTRRGAEADAPVYSESSLIKILDTSVIIDGRIYDICKTGFLEGKLVVPHFVLNELRAISDSEDDLKRSRGRRGLDILARLQNELSRPVEVELLDYDDLQDVDEKLLRMASQLHGIVLTNDFNLNKVAKVHNITVLNINDLANAIKPVVLPGEPMTVRIIKAGKEPGQGVAYLNDGTMIVVERAASFIGDEVSIVVTSALQTSAGRMIFGKISSPVS
ncbi:MAG: TRAM domain-containing protein, partial [Eubacteriales bacterium]|nr:TRAM domain-containing protein [Eubacteriales bacterium]